MSQATMNSVINGVDVERLEVTVQVIQQTPPLARRKEARHEVPPHHRVRRGCSARLCRSQLGHRVDGGARAAEEPF